MTRLILIATVIMLVSGPVWAGESVVSLKNGFTAICKGLNGYAYYRRYDGWHKDGMSQLFIYTYSGGKNFVEEVASATYLVTSLSDLYIQGRYYEARPGYQWAISLDLKNNEVVGTRLLPGRGMLFVGKCKFTKNR